MTEISLKNLQDMAINFYTAIDRPDFDLRVTAYRKRQEDWTKKITNIGPLGLIHASLAKSDRDEFYWELIDMAFDKLVVDRKAIGTRFNLSQIEFSFLFDYETYVDDNYILAAMEVERVVFVENQPGLMDYMYRVKSLAVKKEEEE